MPQTVIIAAGTTALDSASIAIAAGVITSFCIYASTGAVQPDHACDIVYDTPGGDVSIGYLGISCPAIQVQGPATVILRRYPCATACAVVQDT